LLIHGLEIEGPWENAVLVLRQSGRSVITSLLSNLSAIIATTPVIWTSSLRQSRASVITSSLSDVSAITATILPVN
jgi:hypothetical protein